MSAQNDRYWEFDNLPNRLTLFRISLVPVMVALLYVQSENYQFPLQKLYGIFAAIIFTLASLTDYLDGLVARKQGLITAFGSFLDPIADKFLVVSSLIMLLSLGRIPSLVVVILVLREMYMTSLRLFAAHQDIKVPVESVGKWKTATQMIGIPMIMWHWPIFGLPTSPIGLGFLYTAAGLSLISAILYSFKLVKKIQDQRKQKKQASL